MYGIVPEKIIRLFIPPKFGGGIETFLLGHL